MKNARSFFQTHWHDEIEILYAISEPIELILDGLSCYVPSGAAAIVNSGQLHEGRLAGSRNGEIHLVVFHPEMWLARAEDEQLKNLVNALLAGSVRLPTLWLPDNPAAQPVLIQLQALLVMQGDDAPELGKRMAIRGLLNLLLSAILNNGYHLTSLQPEQGDRRNQIERIKAPLAWLHNHYSSEIRLAELARMANFSESQFSRVFRQILGQSVITYLVAYRLRQAALLLAGTDARITDIAINCGFTNQGYFCRCFRNHFKMTPRDYRRKRQDGRLS